VDLDRTKPSYFAERPNERLPSNDLVAANDLVAWSEQAGTSPDSLLQILAQAPPNAVDHVAPNGQVPSVRTDSAALAVHLFAG